MAEEAVCREPVSAVEFPDKGRMQGIFGQISLFRDPVSEIAPPDQGLATKFPMARNRESFSRNRDSNLAKQGISLTRTITSHPGITVKAG